MEKRKIIENKPKMCLKPKTRQRKLRIGVNQQGALKQKDVKQKRVKQGLGVFLYGRGTG